MAEKTEKGFWVLSKESIPVRLKILGTILFVIGLLRYLGFDWNIVLIVLGIVLMAKGFFFKYLEK